VKLKDVLEFHHVHMSNVGIFQVHYNVVSSVKLHYRKVQGS